MEANDLGSEFGKPAASATGLDLESLRKEFNSLKETMATFMTQAGSGAVKSAQDLSSTLSRQGAEVAAGAVSQGKTLAGNIEAMARRNPLATVAGAIVLGILIGSAGRRR